MLLEQEKYEPRKKIGDGDEAEITSKVLGRISAYFISAMQNIISVLW